MNQLCLGGSTVRQANASKCTPCWHWHTGVVLRDEDGQQVLACPLQEQRPDTRRLLSWG